MKSIYKKILQLSLILIIGNITFATDCYVDKNNPEAIEAGTSDNPMSTIAQCTQWGHDTRIMVAPGIYYENVELSGNSSIIGSGIGSTIIVGNGSQTIHLGYESSISKCTISTNNSTNCLYLIYVEATNNGSEIFNCQITSDSSNEIGIYLEHDAKYVKIKNNIFYPSISIGVQTNNWSTELEINNNFFIDCGIDLTNSSGGNHYVHNNIFYDHNNTDGCPLINITPTANNMISYNAISNTFCFDNSVNIENNSSFNFTQHSGQTGDYDNWWTWLQNGIFIFRYNSDSILFDSGNPDSDFNDLDGSRGDIGLYGGEYSWSLLGPTVLYMSVDPIVVPLDGTIQINAKATTE